MAFFDGWGKKITDTVDVVGKKTNDMVEIQKLRSLCRKRNTLSLNRYNIVCIP